MSEIVSRTLVTRAGPAHPQTRAGAEVSII
jgi:hypothetical protein